MASSVHLPERLVKRLDQLARETGRSRNRVIVDACTAYVAQAREAWPDDFFSAEGLAQTDVRTLRGSLREWLETLHSSRRNRRREPF